MSSKVRTLLALAAALVLGAPLAAAAQTGSITGRVVNEQTGEPMSGVQVSIQGTNVGALSTANGQFIITNVPVGNRIVVARFLGFQEAVNREVNVTEGGTALVNFSMVMSVLSLDEVLVSGTVDPVAGVRAPFSIGRVSRENIATVPTTQSALTVIQGKVAGVNIVRNTGEPGTGVSLVLRTPTSIQASNSPMYVVDGVVLASGIGGTTVDIEALDIESVEVIKGAAAASLYGSRAAGGVISITTARGRNLAVDQTRIRVRNEMGHSSINTYKRAAQVHPYDITEDRTQWLNSAGEPTVFYGERTIKADRVMDNPWPGQTFDNVKGLMQPGLFMTNSVEMSYNGETTNFLASVNRYAERGTLVNNSGYERGNFRVNLDHRLGQNFSFSSSVSHTRSTRDRFTGSPFYDMIRIPPTVNFLAKDANGNFLQQPDSTVNFENPAWRQATREWWDRRARTLVSADARYNPTNWLTVIGTVAYDRADLTDDFYLPRGTPTSVTTDAIANGQVDIQHRRNDSYSGSASATAMRNFGQLTARVTGRATAEQENSNFMRARGIDLLLRDVPRPEFSADQRSYSSLTQVRSNGFSLSTGFDYGGRYILDALIRHDGSSLFGEDERWQTYGRVAGAYRMTQERWWPQSLGFLSEFKPRYAIGTAGSRPGFSAQYETWSVSTAGVVSKNTLGNRSLKPAYTVEQEMGVDMIFNNKYQLELTYAQQVTSDQIINMTTAGLTGYNSQWQNAGVMEGRTLELTFEASVIQRPGLSWNTTFVADRSRSEITEWNRSCIGASNTLGEICEGRRLGEMLGFAFVRSLDDLPAHFADRRNEFQVNNDGVVVWVGEGNSWRDGFAKNLWGTQTILAGYPGALRWGHPVVHQDENGFLDSKREIGDSNPDAQLGWLNNINWRGLAIHTHLHAQIGGETYNNTRRAMYREFRHADMDQTGIPRDEQKTVDYYRDGFASGTWFVNEHFVEDASYLKLRALSAQYRFNQGQLARVGLDRFASNLSLGLVGRNLLTLTNYSGMDPEVGGVFFRVDQWYYPPSRTLTGIVEITF